MNNRQITRIIRKGIRQESKINKRRVLGRPWAETPRLATRVYGLIRKYNYNNIMMHLAGHHFSHENSHRIAPDYSGTFNFSRYIEKRLIIDVAQFLNLKFKVLSGYFTAGGTESNIYSLWLARNWSDNKRRHNDVVEWIIPESAHYSVKKALNILGINNNHNHSITYIKRSRDYTIDASDIAAALTTKRLKSDAPIIVVLTIVDTEFGYLDPLNEIIAFIKRSNYKEIFIHVDACFSGIILPALQEYRNVFSYQEISTISIDFHKTFGAPMGSGMVLINNDYQVFSQIHAAYLEHDDLTLLGSRSGTNVIITWALFVRQVQTKLWRKRVTHSIDLASFLYKSIKSIPYIKVIYPPFINYIVFKLDGLDEKQLDKTKRLLREYSITASNYQGQDFYKIITTDYIGKKTLKNLISELRRITI